MLHQADRDPCLRHGLPGPGRTDNQRVLPRVGPDGDPDRESLDVGADDQLSVANPSRPSQSLPVDDPEGEVADLDALLGGLGVVDAMMQVVTVPARTQQRRHQPSGADGDAASRVHEQQHVPKREA